MKQQLKQQARQARLKDKQYITTTNTTTTTTTTSATATTTTSTCTSTSTSTSTSTCKKSGTRLPPVVRSRSPLDAKPPPRGLHILVIQRPGTCNPEVGSGLGSGWDVILPAGYGVSLWRALIYAGARAVGLRDQQHLMAEQGEPSFPRDFPDTTAGVMYHTYLAQLQRTQYERTPPNRRVNYIRYAVTCPFQPNPFSLTGHPTPMYVHTLRRMWDDHEQARLANKQAKREQKENNKQSKQYPENNQQTTDETIKDADANADTDASHANADTDASHEQDDSQAEMDADDANDAIMEVDETQDPISKRTAETATPQKKRKPVRCSMTAKQRDRRMHIPPVPTCGASASSTAITSRAHSRAAPEADPLVHLFAPRLPYYVLRDWHSLFPTLPDACSYLPSLSVLDTEAYGSALLPIRLTVCQVGTPSDGALVCAPSLAELEEYRVWCSGGAKFPELVEPLNKTKYPPPTPKPKPKVKGKGKGEHKVQQTGTAATGTETHTETATETKTQAETPQHNHHTPHEMQPNPEILTCTRPVVGFLSVGIFSFSRGCGFGCGWIHAPAYHTLMQQQRRVASHHHHQSTTTTTTQTPVTGTSTGASHDLAMDTSGHAAASNAVSSSSSSIGLTGSHVLVLIRNTSSRFYHPAIVQLV